MTNPLNRAYGRVAGAISASANRMRDRRALAVAPAHVLRDIGIDPASVRAELPSTLSLLMLLQH